ncbi:helix-turn-helix domain-containing protein [Kocuria koreensis]|jgi:DNA-binding IclR family transcriptional regulator|uniref:Helix-turn-helix domain-containing protein n=1 Tax=Rothia koreensis TaxID=592378 RepID=A0A7K1LJ29_9MICC|nr:IclR family transcriptional regulator [Rothia koreensis]MUN55195.1 helix-turn-helix domain-containing protein [Rothia koreensis]
MTDKDLEATSGTTGGNRSVARAVQIIRAVAGSPDPVTVSEVARIVDLPRPTVFRILLTLEEEGFVDRSSNHYKLGWDLARIARSVDPTVGIAARVEPIVQGIAEDLEDTVTLSVMQGPGDLDLVMQKSPRTMAVRLNDMSGMKWPLHASATGKLVLADLKEQELRSMAASGLKKIASKTITDYDDLVKELESVRGNGWAEIEDELEDGVYSLAVPIQDSHGVMVAALALVAQSYKFDSVSFRNEKLRILLNGAHDIKKLLYSATSNEDNESSEGSIQVSQ